MQPDERFSYRSLDELIADLARAGLDLPVSQDVSLLARPVRYGRLTVPNRLCAQPMEGCDGTARGAPTDLTVRRYQRLGAGGAGLIWFEATAVAAEGRANPRQLWLHEETADAFRRLVDVAREAAHESMGHNPVCVLQLTHSGRYSRPVDKPAPIIAHHSAVLDGHHGLPPDYPLIADEQLDALQEDFVGAAVLAAQAGFDAVDVKSCHRYLISELLASFRREGSRYGGSYENRTRMLRETAAAIRKRVGDRIEVTCRLNAYDAIEYPYGWGVDRDDVRRPDLAEPIRLVGELAGGGFGGVNITVANPYYNPHVNRPADWMIADWPDPPERPLEGVARIIHVARDVQRAYPDLPIVGSGYTWLRHYMPAFAAGSVAGGWASIVGLGRGALAYPDFAKDILRNGELDPYKVCVCCSSCTQVMRDGGRTGCVVRDSDVYGPIFREGRDQSTARLRQLAARCRRCISPTCTRLCPAGVDVPGFLGALADGEEHKAYDILREANCLPGICGSVCPADVQCQSGCIQSVLADGPVPIAAIQRNLSLRAIEAGWAAVEAPAACTDRRVAVVGAGPAGLAAAWQLIRRGHRVAILDRARQPGGKLAAVIPRRRLDEQLIRAEIDALFAAVPSDRIAWRLGEALDAGRTLDHLMAEGFDAAVLALGLTDGNGLSDEPPPQGVLVASRFLRQLNRNPDHSCPRRVAVIGGGNSAIDAATCARRHGALDVYAIYRRSFAEMPAWPKEREEALQAGVHLLVLAQAIGYVADATGRLTGVRVARTKLSEPDESGRRVPVLIPGSEFVVEADLAVEALGEVVGRGLTEALAGVELTADGLVRVGCGTFRTTRSGVWAVGDLVNGGTTVVRAVAEGMAAAGDIDAHLRRAPAV